MIANRLLKNFLSLSAAGLVHSVVAVVSTIYLARVLEPEGYGRISFAFAFVQYFLILSAFGLDIVGIRSVAREKDKVKEYVGNIMAIKLTVTLVLFLALVVIIPFLDRPTETNKMMLIYGLVLFPSALFFEWTWQGLERMGNIGISKIIRQILYLGAILLLVKSRDDAYLVAFIFFAVNTLYAVILFLLFVKDYGMIRFKFNKAQWHSLATQAIPVGISQVMGIMLSTLSIVLLGFLATDEDVGYYNAAFQFQALILTFICIYFDALFPTISRLYYTSINKMQMVLAFSGKMFLLIALPISVGGMILSKGIMHTIYGEKYDGGIAVLQILIWTVVVSIFNTVYARGLLASNRQVYYMKIVGLQLITNLFLNIVLIPPFGVKGAAVATLAGEIVGVYPYYMGIRKVFNIKIWTYLLKPAIAAVAMAFFLFSFKLPLIFLVVAGGALYLVVLVITRGISTDDIKQVQRIVAGNA